jgi:hypothetical protein
VKRIYLGLLNELHKQVIYENTCDVLLLPESKVHTALHTLPKNWETEISGST